MREEQSTSGLPIYSKLLREFRQIAGLTQDMLGRKAGLTKNDISKLENANVIFPDTINEKLAGALGLDAEQSRQLVSAYADYKVAVEIDFKKKIAPIVEEFGKFGITEDNYFKAALKEMRLFYSDPQTVIGNIKGVCDRFKGDGLKVADYLEAALNFPQLFRTPSKTIINKIITVYDRFKDEVVEGDESVSEGRGRRKSRAKNKGVTLADYIGAVLEKPQLLSMDPQRIINNITGFCEQFKEYNLTVASYFRAALDFPQLFYSSPQTIAEKVEVVCEHFKGNGLTKEKYLLEGVKKNPSLLALSAERIINNITGVYNRFKDDGLTLEKYLMAAVKQPSLFGQSPDTISEHICIIKKMYEKELFTTKHEFWDYIVANPQLIRLSSDNLKARAIYSYLEKWGNNGVPLTANRVLSGNAKKAEIQDGLFRRLNAPDEGEPIAPYGFLAEYLRKKALAKERAMLGPEV